MSKSNLSSILENSVSSSGSSEESKTKSKKSVSGKAPPQTFWGHIKSSLTFGREYINSFAGFQGVGNPIFSASKNLGNYYEIYNPISAFIATIFNAMLNLLPDYLSFNNRRELIFGFFKGVQEALMVSQFAFGFIVDAILIPEQLGETNPCAEIDSSDFFYWTLTGLSIVLASSLVFHKMLNIVNQKKPKAEDWRAYGRAFGSSLLAGFATTLSLSSTAFVVIKWFQELIDLKHVACLTPRLVRVITSLVIGLAFRGLPEFGLTFTSLVKDKNSPMGKRIRAVRKFLGTHFDYTSNMIAAALTNLQALFKFKAFLYTFSGNFLFNLGLPSVTKYFYDSYQKHHESKGLNNKSPLLN